MSVIILVEHTEQKIKKVSFETASYARKMADAEGGSVVAVAINLNDSTPLSQYGVDKVVNINHEKLQHFNAKAYAAALAQVASAEGAKFVVLSSTTDSLYLAPLVAVNLQAGYASNVVALPINYAPFQVKRSAFSNKAFQVTEINTDIKVLSIAKNSYGIHESALSTSQSSFEPNISDADLGVKTQNLEKVSGKVTIADAEVVVSGGRGLKGPENWGLIENLAEALGAATACSKPVSDLGWRPHSEHVGQTGKPVASNLYIAVGVSGAIQHIAGVNSSKVKVVINTDPEAPFFKVADYGIVGDAFDILPRLTEKIREFKKQNA
jgi:electron transfer flavoprotein alpha subunit